MLDTPAFNLYDNPLHTGFTITFLNGITVSICWGEMNYSDHGATTAECAAYDTDGKFIHVNGFHYNGDDVLPRLSAEDVARFMFSASVM